MSIFMKNGIGLISLVITIVVLLIISSTVVMIYTNDGLLSKAQKTSLKSDFETFRAEYKISLADKQIKDMSFDKTTVNATWNGIDYENILAWIPSMKEMYSEKIEIIDGELTYIGNNNFEALIAQELDIQIGVSE